jgi:hypothetical protein
MEQLTIPSHTPEAWRLYGDTFGFVPDPMILRAGEIFLNGSNGGAKLHRNLFRLWEALEQNILGLVEFFDMVATRDRIPLINYWYTYDRAELSQSIEALLPGKVCNVEIGYDVYKTIKEGALVALADLDLAAAPADAFGMLMETAVFGYDWKPDLAVPDSSDPEVAAATSKLTALDGPRLPIAQFLLGGLIFGGFAQASQTRHYIQPKRSRLFLGVTAAQDKVSPLSAQAEDEIFTAAEVALRGGKVEFRRAATLPPVLPYLLASNPAPQRPEDLLAKALEFPTTPDGRNYVAAARALRADGIEARRVEDLSQVEHHAALEWLARYSNLVPEKSQSLDIKQSSELIGLPGAEASFKLGIPRLAQDLVERQGAVRRPEQNLPPHVDGRSELQRSLREALPNLVDELGEWIAYQRGEDWKKIQPQTGGEKSAFADLSEAVVDEFVESGSQP